MEGITRIVQAGIFFVPDFFNRMFVRKFYRKFFRAIRFDRACEISFLRSTGLAPLPAWACPGGDRG